MATKPTTDVNKIKKFQIQEFYKLNKNKIPSDSFVIVEILGEHYAHQHLKGSKGGSRVYVEESLKQLEGLKGDIANKTDGMNQKTISLFAKSVAPIIIMAQNLLNQPTEAFLGGFTDEIPHILACYQKDSSKMKAKLLKDYGVTPENIGNLPVSLKQMMNAFWSIDVENRKKLQDVLPFNPKKCIAGYIQQLFVSADQWAVICFREAQLLAMLCDLKVQRAMMWDGTEPNTKKEDNVMMFDILTRAGYGTFKNSRFETAVPAPCKVVARLFATQRTAAVQKQFFQLLIDKSAEYCLTPLSLKGVVLVTDMDPMIDEVVQHFEMKHYWDHRHVNQALKHYLDGKPCQKIVFNYMHNIRECENPEDADKLVQSLKAILSNKTSKQKSTNETVQNPFYSPDIWSYLNGQYFKHMDKLCKWTIKDLPEFWRWSQAIESRNNKDLNLWNQGVTGISTEEAILRFSEIDKAEMRQAYLHFMAAEYQSIERSVTSQRRDIGKKFKIALIREYADFMKPANEETVASEDEPAQDDPSVEPNIVEKTDPPVEPNIVEKTEQLRKLLESRPTKKEEEIKLAKTTFGRPTKQRKPNFSTDLDKQQKNLVGIFENNIIPDDVPLEQRKGKQVVADYYHWDKKYLNAKNSKAIISLGIKHAIPKARSSTKKDLIKSLIEKRKELMQDWHSKESEIPKQTLDFEEAISFDQADSFMWTKLVGVCTDCSLYIIEILLIVFSLI